jgi:hypothetical protein
MRTHHIAYRTPPNRPLLQDRNSVKFLQSFRDLSHSEATDGYS